MIKTEVIDEILQAAEALRQGKLVAFATETVYGLGVDATNDQAIARLFQAKGRPADNPLIVHVGDLNQWPLVAERLPPAAEKLLQKFAPGPITVVVPKQASISSLVTAGLPTVGLRIPDHPQAQSLLQQCNLPIAAPSANRSGRPSCTTWQSVLEDLDGRIDFILRGEICRIGIESTVIQCTADPPCILRAGQVTLEQVRQVIPQAQTLDSSQSQLVTNAPSPGLRHPHYQPAAEVILFQDLHELDKLAPAQRHGSAIALWTVATSSPQLINASDIEHSAVDRHSLIAEFAIHRMFTSIEQYAQQFYEFMRQADRANLQCIYLQLVPSNDQASALRDRMLRAAKPRQI